MCVTLYKLKPLFAEHYKVKGEASKQLRQIFTRPRLLLSLQRLLFLSEASDFLTYKIELIALHYSKLTFFLGVFCLFHKVFHPQPMFHHWETSEHIEPKEHKSYKKGQIVH